MNKKIAVLGTGANGSCTAADLIHNGYDVTLIDQWPAHVEAMRADGLTIKMPDEELHVEVRAHHLCDVATFQEPFDYVLLMPKAYDTKWLAHLIEPCLATDGLMVGIQNAMTAEDIADIVGRDRTIGCVVELSSEIFTPGVVQRNTPPAKSWFGLGALDADMADRVPEIQEILENVGKVSIPDDILSAKWMKLVVNTMCLGPLAMLGLTLYEAVKVPGVREFVVQAGTEALAVGQQRGYTIQPIFGLTPDDIKETNRLLEMLFDKLAADIGPSARDCALQDHLKGRYSEVDLINGLVAEESADAGHSAPANAAITEITRQIHDGRLKPDPSNLQRAMDLMSA
jgi:2-dehydropantoate 2-reductase